jgi:outer membrane protein W
VGANIGYYAKSNEVLGIKIRIFVMPITALFEYSFSDNDFSHYLGGDMGIYRFGISKDGNTSANGYFGFAPVVGFDYKLSDHLLLNSNLKIHLIFTNQETTTAFTINVGLCYKF